MKAKRFGLALTLCAGLLSVGGTVDAQDLFKKEIGSVTVGPVKDGGPIETPFITWGGDVATFHANGGTDTTGDSIMGKMGLKLKLRNGDNFIEQCQRYLKGETPFLRGTLRMMALAAEKLSENPDTTPVCFLQLTWSGGDHMVSRENLVTAADLKGKTIALQKGGPHVGLLNDILATAKLTYDDIHLVWCDDLTGPKGAAARFKSDEHIDACLVITPDMVTLCGGLNETGSGAENSVRGAHVLVSTSELSRSIADVYCVRRDYYQKHPDVVKKFAAGYLKGTEELLAAKKAWEANGAKPYMGVLKMAQDILGKEVLPTLEADAHGLVCDARFVGLPGNQKFFNEGDSSITNFGPKSIKAIDHMCEVGFAKDHGTIENAHLDFGHLKTTGGLQAKVTEKKADKFVEMSPEDLFPDDPVKMEKEGKKEIFSFQINFQPNQDEFPHAKYAKQFQRALESSQLFGSAVMAIGGHADPTLMLRQVVEAGLKGGKLTRTGSRGNWKYSLGGKPFDLANTQAVIKEIKAGTFGARPKATYEGLIKLSQRRAANVKKALLEYARMHNMTFDDSQFQPVGVGAREPKAPMPHSRAEMQKNMRVEFRLVRVPAEALKESDFDY